jgi:hypothetical protein
MYGNEKKGKNSCKEIKSLQIMRKTAAEMQLQVEPCE